MESTFDLSGGEKMTCQNKYKPNFVGRKTGGIFDANDPGDVVGCLNKSRANYHPTIRLSVEYCLRDVCGRGESE